MSRSTQPFAQGRGDQAAIVCRKVQTAASKSVPPNTVDMFRVFEFAQSLHLIPLFLLQLLLTVVIEGLILYKVGYQKLLPSLAYSTLANLVSVVLTVLCLMALSRNGQTMPASWMMMAVFYAVSIAAELLVLRACRRDYPLRKLTPVIFVMNVLSQSPLYYFLLS